MSQLVVSALFTSIVAAAKRLLGNRLAPFTQHVFLLKSFTISNGEHKGIQLGFLRFTADQINRDASKICTVIIPLGYSVAPSDIVELLVVQRGEDYNQVTMIIINDDEVIDVNQSLILRSPELGVLS